MDLEKININNQNKFSKNQDELLEYKVKEDVDFYIGEYKLKLTHLYFKEYNLRLLKETKKITNPLQGEFEKFITPFFKVVDKKDSLEKHYLFGEDEIDRLPFELIQWYVLIYLIEQSERSKISVSISDYCEEDYEKQEKGLIQLLPTGDSQALVDVKFINKKFPKNFFNNEIVKLKKKINISENISCDRICIPPTTLSIIPKQVKDFDDNFLNEGNIAKSTEGVFKSLVKGKVIHCEDIYFMDENENIIEGLSDKEKEKISGGITGNLIDKIMEIKNNKFSDNIISGSGVIKVINKDSQEKEDYKTKFKFEIPMPFFFFSSGIQG